MHSFSNMTKKGSTCVFAPFPPIKKGLKTVSVVFKRKDIAINFEKDHRGYSKFDPSKDGTSKNKHTSTDYRPYTLISESTL